MKRINIWAFTIATFGLMACAQNKSQPAKAAQQEQNIKQEKEKNMGVQNLTAALFKQNIMDYEKHPNDWVFQGERPVVIDFFATWCGPCKATAPIVEELAKEYAGKIDFYKVDVDQEEELAALFGIRSIPSLLFIPKDGKPQMQVGAMNKQQFEEQIKAHLLKSKGAALALHGKPLHIIQKRNRIEHYARCDFFNEGIFKLSNHGFQIFFNRGDAT